MKAIVNKLCKRDVLVMPVKEFLEKHKPYLTCYTRINYCLMCSDIGLKKDLYEAPVAELCKMKRSDLMKLRNFGKLCLQELSNILSFYGLGLGNDYSKEFSNYDLDNLKQEILKEISPIIERAVEQIIKKSLRLSNEQFETEQGGV